MYGYRSRIGYTSPPMLTEVFPYEFYRIAPPGVTLVVTSLAVLDVTRDELETSYDISLRAAKEMAKGGVNLVILGGVPINSVKGVDKIEEMIEELEGDCGVPISTSVTAQVHALRAVGARRVVSLSPSVREGREPGNAFLSHFGFEPLAIEGGDCLDGRDWGRVPVERAMEWGRALIRKYPQADTLHMLCPHWATLDSIEPIEQELGVNVITASQAIIWEGLRRCDIAEPVPGYGRLLRDH